MVRAIFFGRSVIAWPVLSEKIYIAIAAPTGLGHPAIPRPKNNTTYAVVESGAAKPPKSFFFLPMVAGFAGNNQQRRCSLAGLQLSKPPNADDCVTCE